LESTSIQEFGYYYYYFCYCYNNNNHHNHHHPCHSSRAVTFSSFCNAKGTLCTINLASFNSPYLMQLEVFLPCSSETVTKPYLIQTNPSVSVDIQVNIDLPYILSNSKVRDAAVFSTLSDPFRLCKYMECPIENRTQVHRKFND
jgi:hypothetical protein